MASNAMLSLLGSDGGRDNLRFRVLFSATLVTSTDQYAVTVRDLSTTGAGIEGARLPSAGADVLLRRRSTDFFARVSWSAGGHAGIEFDEPISAAELIAQLNAGARFGTGTAAREPMSAEDLAIARAWLRGEDRGDSAAI